MECANSKSSQEDYRLLLVYILRKLPLQIQDDYVLGLQLDLHIFHLRCHHVQGSRTITEKHEEEEGQREPLKKQMDVKYRKERKSQYRYNYVLLLYCTMRRLHIHWYN